eukprot:GHRR01011598.1.p1 GENE.GHRR01011598.1~~GHRR01011598.1.p1  ORF type:complete len:369 (+),score=113.06 GHRR01011598.1:125-1231(+)
MTPGFAINGKAAKLSSLNQQRQCNNAMAVLLRQCGSRNAGRRVARAQARHRVQVQAAAALVSISNGTAAAAAATAALAPQQDVCSLAAEQQFEQFCSHAQSGANIVPLYQRIFSDQLTPVLAYRCLVEHNDTNAPSFLLESVVNGDQSGRYSFVGAMPALEVVAKGHQVTVLNHQTGSRHVSEEADPMDVPVRLSRNWKPAQVQGVPAVFTGGWVGYAGYDTVRYVYGNKIPFSAAPSDDRQLPDMHLALYNDVVVFDQATKLIYIIAWVHLNEDTTATSSSSSSNGGSSSSSRDPELLRVAFDSGRQRLQYLVRRLSSTPPSLTSAQVRKCARTQSISMLHTAMSTLGNVLGYRSSGFIYSQCTCFL